MINFQLESENIVVTGDHEIFNNTEIGDKDKRLRKQIEFEIEPLQAKEQRALKEKHTKKTIPEAVVSRIKASKGINKKGEKSLREILLEMNIGVLKNFNEDEYIIDVIVTKLKKWNIVDINGKEIPCNKKNKEALFNGGYPRLGAAIYTIINQAIARRKYYEKEQEKN